MIKSIALTEQRPDSKQFITIEGGLSELSPEIIRNSITGLEKAMHGLPDESKCGAETMHNFTDGIYVRTVFMKAGTLFTGKTHKLEHTVIVSKGVASIVDAALGASLLKAPAIFISPPGSKRLFFVHEDLIFTTIHPNPSNTRDIAKLEAELTIPQAEEKQCHG